MLEVVRGLHGVRGYTREPLAYNKLLGKQDRVIGGRKEGLPLDRYEFGLDDSNWPDEEWSRLLRELIRAEIVTWKDVTTLVLGHLNPPQVGTALASSPGFKARYGKGNTMRVVIRWLYQQSGRCADCGSRLELQADHRRPREEFSNPLEADYIENMELRCRRCNVIRRPSHVYGGRTHLTAESALMWILFCIRPRTFLDFVRLCRLYGLTMADIRMQEAWAMAYWLPWYEIEEDSSNMYDLLLWSDNAITRRRTGAVMPGDPEPLYQGVPGNYVLGFIARKSSAKAPVFYEMPLHQIPFSTYDLGSRPRNDIAVKYRAPDRRNGRPPRLLPLPPRDMQLLAHSVRKPNSKFIVKWITPSRNAFERVLEPFDGGGSRTLHALADSIAITLKEDPGTPSRAKLQGY